MEYQGEKIICIYHDDNDKILINNKEPNEKNYLLLSVLTGSLKHHHR